MAIINKGILGGFSGKVGNIVGANLRGVDIIRSLPSKSKKATTEPQKKQRDAFGAAAKLLKPVNAVLSAYFGNTSGALTRRNLAMSYTLTEVVAQGPGGIVVNYAKVLLTKGDLAGFQNLQVAAQAGGLNFGWEDNSAQGNAAATDVFCSAIYCEAQDLWDMQESSTRQEASANVALPAVMSGKAVHIYVYFRSANAAAASTSVYPGTVTPP